MTPQVADTGASDEVTKGEGLAVMTGLWKVIRGVLPTSPTSLRLRTFLPLHALLENSKRRTYAAGTALPCAGAVSWEDCRSA
jgi:hypothetical protein